MNIKGNKVVDAKSDLVLIVLARDIAHADRKKANRCVIAKACSRQEKMEAVIHLTRVYLRNGEDHWKRYILPQSLRGELIAFDRGGAFIPGTYVLDAPKGGTRLGKHKSGKRGKMNASSLRKKPTYIKDIRANLYNVAR
jgi:hypothetical protein